MYLELVTYAYGPFEHDERWRLGLLEHMGVFVRRGEVADQQAVFPFGTVEQQW